MPRQGVKIRDLARELSVTSRVVLQRCREEGVHVQNSITRVDEDTAETIRKWFRPPEGDGSAEPHRGE